MAVGRWFYSCGLRLLDTLVCAENCYYMEYSCYVDTPTIWRMFNLIRNNVYNVMGNVDKYMRVMSVLIRKTSTYSRYGGCALPPSGWDQNDGISRIQWCVTRNIKSDGSQWNCKWAKLYPKHFLHANMPNNILDLIKDKCR